MRKPSVSILIVNYNGKALLEEMLPSVLAQTYPKSLMEIIVVDNNSQDDSVPFIKKHFPQIKLVESEENTGFTGGNTLGLSHSVGEYIVMLNSDVVVEPTWLDELVSAASPKEVGLVSSRLRYFIPFVEMSIVSDAYPRSQMNRSIDHTPVGVTIEDVVCQNDHDSDLVLYKQGFLESQEGDCLLRATNGNAKLLLPFNSYLEKNIYRITLHALRSNDVSPQRIRLLCGDSVLFEAVMNPFEVRQVTLSIDKAKINSNFTWLVQNAGNLVMRNGYGKDRGSISLKNNSKEIQSYEEESEYFLTPCELLSVCGASCLVKRKVIDQIGFLDGYYFMYYEDMEFSLRAWRAGWKLVYAPKSIGYHRHRATTGIDETSFFLEHVERNHLSFVLAHFPFSTFVSEFVFFLIRLCFSCSLSFAFQFRDLNIAHKYKIRHMGRKAALKYILRSFWRLIKSRKELDSRWPINHAKMAKYLY